MAACLLMLAASANAQSPDAQAPEPGSCRVTTFIWARRLIIDDQRFSWDTHFGGSIDAIDYVVGRLSGIVDYEAILGNEFRAFDPNQGNYTLEVSASYRIGDGDCWGVSSRLATLERPVQAFPDRLECGRRECCGSWRRKP